MFDFEAKLAENTGKLNKCRAGHGATKTETLDICIQFELVALLYRSLSQQNSNDNVLYSLFVHI